MCLNSWARKQGWKHLLSACSLSITNWNLGDGDAEMTFVKARSRRCLVSQALAINTVSLTFSNTNDLWMWKCAPCWQFNSKARLLLFSIGRAKNALCAIFFWPKTTFGQRRNKSINAFAHKLGVFGHRHQECFSEDTVFPPVEINTFYHKPTVCWCDHKGVLSSARAEICKKIGLS